MYNRRRGWRILAFSTPCLARDKHHCLPPASPYQPPTSTSGEGLTWVSTSHLTFPMSWQCHVVCIFAAPSPGRPPQPLAPIACDPTAHRLLPLPPQAAGLLNSADVICYTPGAEQEAEGHSRGPTAYETHTHLQKKLAVPLCESWRTAGYSCATTPHHPSPWAEALPPSLPTPHPPHTPHPTPPHPPHTHTPPLFPGQGQGSNHEGQEATPQQAVFVPW